MNKLKSQIKLERESRILLLIHGLFNTSTSLSNLFVGIYLWRVEKDYITVATYYLMLFVFSTLAYILSGWLLTKWGRMTIYRVGILFHCLFYMILLILEDRAAFYPIELGSIQGIALGFYWLSFNVLAYESTKQDNRSYFYGLNGLILSVAGVIGPLLAGVVLYVFPDLSGYYIIFTVTLLIYLITGIISLRLKTGDISSKYHLKSALQPTKWTQSWKLVLAGSFMYGTREGIFMFIINLLVYISTASELKLGWFNSLSSILSIGVFYMVGRFLRQEQNGKFMFIGVIGITCATSILIYDINFYTLLLFGITNAFFMPYLLIPYSTIGFDVMDQSPHIMNLRTEYIVVREIAVNLGRVIPILLFIFLFDGSNIVLLKLFIFFPCITLILVWWFLSGIETRKELKV